MLQGRLILSSEMGGGGVGVDRSTQDIKMFHRQNARNNTTAFYIVHHVLSDVTELVISPGSLHINLTIKT